MQIGRLLSLSVGILMSIAPSARGADLPTARPAPVLNPLWSGFYVGANAGYGWGESSSINAIETLIGAPFFAGNFGTTAPDGFFGGVQAGYNFRTNNLVLGLEADIQAASIRDRSGATTPYFFPGSTMTLSVAQRLDWLSTVRARAGYTWDNLLIYGTGGFAFGNVRQALVMTDTMDFSAAASRSSNRSGYVLGAGVEYAITANWSAKLEYQYINLGTSRIGASEVFTGNRPSPFAISSPLATRLHTARLGINYRF